MHSRFGVAMLGLVLTGVACRAPTRAQVGPFEDPPAIISCEWLLGAHAFAGGRPVGTLEDLVFALDGRLLGLHLRIADHRFLLPPRAIEGVRLEPRHVSLGLDRRWIEFGPRVHDAGSAEEVAATVRAHYGSDSAPSRGVDGRAHLMTTTLSASARVAKTSEHLGDIEDAFVALDSARVALVCIDTGILDADRHALPWQLAREEAPGSFGFATTAQALIGAPSIDAGPVSVAPEWLQSVQEHYALRPSSKSPPDARGIERTGC